MTTSTTLAKCLDFKTLLARKPNQQLCKENCARDGRGSLMAKTKMIRQLLNPIGLEDMLQPLLKLIHLQRKL
jgi:hypothetical protein